MFRKNPTVLAAGFVGKRFILLTKNLYIFDVSKDYLDEIKNLLELTEPRTLQEKYSNLFQQIRKQNQKILNAVLLSDNESDWLVLIFNKTIINFDLKNQIIINKKTDLNMTSKALISSSTIACFYIVKLNNDNSTDIGQIGLYFNQTLITSIRYSNRIGLIDGYKKICQFINPKLNNIFYNNNNELIDENLFQPNCVRAFNFTIKNGFLTKNKIYLFDNVHVYIINRGTFQNNQPFTFVRKKINNFFICSSQVNSFGKFN